MENKINEILNEMADYLSAEQQKKLQQVLIEKLSENRERSIPASNDDYTRLFLNAKKIEGCSERTILYYQATLNHFFASINAPARRISTEQIRAYLADYQKINNCSNATVDNIRRNISSFFSWMEEEDHLLKSPMHRIHKIKTVKQVKEIISDEVIEKLRDSCKCARDLAIIDLLYSTGMRVGELVKLNRSDVNFEERECIVFGKGDKERRVYFDA